MNQDFLTELDDIQIDLTRSASMVFVIADGLNAFARGGVPSSAAASA